MPFRLGPSANSHNDRSVLPNVQKTILTRVLS